jgi:hypothetical protein
MIVYLETLETRWGKKQVWVAREIARAWRGEGRTRKAAIANLQPEANYR